MKKLYLLTRDEFYGAVSMSRSVSEVCSRFSTADLVDPSLHVFRRITLLGIDCSHFRIKPYMPNADRVEAALVANSRLGSSNVKRLILRLNLLPYKCQECGLAPPPGNVEVLWNGKRLDLQLDHISGDPTDNRLVNLRFLCGHCHSQTLTFCRSKHSASHREDITPESLSMAVQQTSSFTECLRFLGYSTGTSNFRTLKHRIEKWGIELPNSWTKKEPLEAGATKPLGSLCRECSGPCTAIAGRCRKCARIASRRVKRPELAQLLADVKALGYSGSGRKYGVSDNAVKKWLKLYGHDVKTSRKRTIPLECRPDILVVHDFVAQKGIAAASRKWKVDAKTLKKWLKDGGLEVPRKKSKLESSGLTFKEIMDMVDCRGIYHVCRTLKVDRRVLLRYVQVHKIDSSGDISE